MISNRAYGNQARASLRQRWAFSAHAQRSGVGRIDSLAKRPETQVIRRVRMHVCRYAYPGMCVRMHVCMHIHAHAAGTHDNNMCLSACRSFVVLSGL